MGCSDGSANCTKDTDGVGGRPVVARGGLKWVEISAGVVDGKMRRVGTVGVGIDDSSHDIPQPVHIGVLDGILIEEVMLHERDAAVYERLRILFRPDNLLALFEDGASVLQYESQLWVESAELDGKASCVIDQHEWVLGLLFTKIGLTHSTANIYYCCFAKLVPRVI